MRGEGDYSGAAERAAIEEMGRMQLEHEKELAEVRRDRDAALARVAALTAERDEARADYLAVAQAAGYVYEADGHAVQPADMATVVRGIRDALARVAELERRLSRIHEIVNVAATDGHEKDSTEDLASYVVQDWDGWAEAHRVRMRERDAAIAIARAQTERAEKAERKAFEGWAHAGQVQTERDAALAELRAVEWCPDDDGLFFCPRCGANREDGHDADCETAAALASAPAPTTREPVVPTFCPHCGRYKEAHSTGRHCDDAGQPPGGKEPTRQRHPLFDAIRNATMRATPATDEEIRVLREVDADPGWDDGTLAPLGRWPGGKARREAELADEIRAAAPEPRPDEPDARAELRAALDAARKAEDVLVNETGRVEKWARIVLDGPSDPLIQPLDIDATSARGSAT